MRVTYDPEVDAAYVYLREVEAGGAVYTYLAEPEIQIDDRSCPFAPVR